MYNTYPGAIVCVGLLQQFHLFFFFSSRRRHTRCSRDWSSDVCSSDLLAVAGGDEPRPIAHRAQERYREIRARPDQVEEGISADRKQSAIRFRDHGGEAWCTVYQRHLAEHASRSDFFHELVPDGNGKATLEHDVHHHPRLAFLHDHLVAPVAHRRLRERPRENGECGFVEYRGFFHLALRGGDARIPPGERIADAADHDAHQHERELGFFPQGALKLAVVERDEAAGEVCHSGCAAGHIANRRHLAEDLDRKSVV